MQQLLLLVALFAVLCLIVASSNAPGASRRPITEPKRSTGNGWVKDVPWLPGWPKGKPLPAKLFSGFVDVSDGKPKSTTKMMMHYLMFLSESNPEEDPLIVWWNGGPGAPSSWGLFVELGPLLLNDASYLTPEYNLTGIPSPVENPFGWTKFANLIVFENPPPVGFSYCSPPGPTGNGTSCGVWDDQRVGAVNAEALHIIFSEHFPHFITPQRQIFFVGESYAGVYIGTTAKALFSDSARYSLITSHIAGVAFGDACLGTSVLCGANTFGPWGHIMFFYGHGQFPNILYDELMRNCTVEELKSPNPLSAKCESAVRAVYSSIGLYYAYNLIDDCSSNIFLPKKGGRTIPGVGFDRRAGNIRTRKRHPSAFGLIDESHDVIDQPPPAEYYSGYFCASDVFEVYVNVSEVRTVLHVPENASFFVADNARGLQYNLTEKNVLPMMYSLLNSTNNTREKGVDIMSYNGDTDPSVDMFDSQRIWYEFARNNSVPVDEPWRVWTTHKGVVGGHVATWLDSTSRGVFSYVTVLGSGHMIPEYRGKAALVLFSNWVAHRPLPFHK